MSDDINCAFNLIALFNRQELADHADQLEQQKLWQEEAKEKKKLDLEARKNHYLLSTEVIPGIYNSPFQPYVSGHNVQS